MGLLYICVCVMVECAYYSCIRVCIRVPVCIYTVIVFMLHTYRVCRLVSMTLLELVFVYYGGHRVLKMWGAAL